MIEIAKFLAQAMAPAFTIIEHEIPGQHIREYAAGTKNSQEDVLKISVKQYKPTRASDSIPANALTIIGAHGNGFPKVGKPSFVKEICFHH